MSGTQPVTVGLRSSGAALITMADREHRNTFSDELMRGLTQEVRRLACTEAVKVLVLTGYDTYFCCGGTKEELLLLHEGQRTFDEHAFYRLLLDCELPVISAMQGHAIGAGLAFGCYADLIVMSEESLYSASFMKYGFTPGFGATWMIPEKIGPAIGGEMLFTARNYHGAELKRRGALPAIVPRAEVLTVALRLADELAEKPRLALKLLKAQLARRALAALPGVIEEELAMHRETFGQPEVRERIEHLF